jgi:hypothetical protein
LIGGRLRIRAVSRAAPAFRFGKSRVASVDKKQFSGPALLLHGVT